MGRQNGGIQGRQGLAVQEVADEVVCGQIRHRERLNYAYPTPEAVLVSMIDNLDAKIHTFTREIRDDPARESSWTPFNQNLGRRLFKGSAGGLNGSEAEIED